MKFTAQLWQWEQVAARARGHSLEAVKVTGGGRVRAVIGDAGGDRVQENGRGSESQRERERESSCRSMWWVERRLGRKMGVEVGKG